MNLPAHITIDVAGTLLRPDPSVGDIYAEVLLEHGGEAVPDVLEARFREAFGRHTPSGRMDRSFWIKIVRETLGEDCPADRFDGCFNDLWETFAEGRRWGWAEGAEDALLALRKRGHILAVLSNNDTRLRRVLADKGVLEYFADVFISEAVGASKPSLEIFQHVERCLDCNAAELMHIGDSLEADYLGAKNAGWEARLLGKARPDSVPEADWWAGWECALQ